MTKRLLCVIVLILFLCESNLAQDKPQGTVTEVPLYLTIELTYGAPSTPQEPGAMIKTVVGMPIKIRGAVGSNLAGKPLKIEIAQPAPEGVITLNVTASAKRTFEAPFTPKIQGIHKVSATAENSARGEVSFEAKESGTFASDELDHQATQLMEHAKEMIEIVRKKLLTIPDSPAKQEATKKAEEIETQIDQMPQWEWTWQIRQLPKLQKQDPVIRKQTEPLAKKFVVWQQQATAAEKAYPRVHASLTQGNVACDQLDAVINGLKFCSFYMGLATTPARWIVDWAKENVPTKLLSLLPDIRRTPAVSEGIELSWRALLGREALHEPVQKDVTGKDYEEVLKEADERAEKRMERALTIQKLSFNLSQYVTSRVFDAYCEQFQGPIKGSMDAQFYHEGQIWWKYTIKIEGELILRYPKNEQVSAMTGEFLGNATTFVSWDNAIPVLFPKLGSSTVFKQFRFEPLSMSAPLGVFGAPIFSEPLKDAKVGGEPVPSLNPLNSAIEQGGQIARFMVTPAFFKIPVSAQFGGRTIHLELKNAIQDFDDARVKVYTIMVPVVAVNIIGTSYALPYKGAHFMIGRAMNDAPFDFEVEFTRKSMSIKHQFTRNRESGDTKATYVLSVEACNPKCE